MSDLCIELCKVEKVTKNRLGLVNQLWVDADFGTFERNADNVTSDICPLAATGCAWDRKNTPEAFEGNWVGSLYHQPYLTDFQWINVILSGGENLTIIEGLTPITLQANTTYYICAKIRFIPRDWSYPSCSDPTVELSPKPWPAGSESEPYKVEWRFASGFAGSTIRTYSRFESSPESDFDWHSVCAEIVVGGANDTGTLKLIDILPTQAFSYEDYVYQFLRLPPPCPNVGFSVMQREIQIDFISLGTELAFSQYKTFKEGSCATLNLIPDVDSNITYKLRDIFNLDTLIQREFTKTFVLAQDSIAKRYFGNIQEVCSLSGEKSLKCLYRAKLIKNGMTLLNGIFNFTNILSGFREITKLNGQVVGSNREWLTLLQDEMLKDLDYTADPVFMDIDSVEQSWLLNGDSGSLVVFFPFMVNDQYAADPSGKYVAGSKIRVTEIVDLKAGVFVKQMLIRIFEQIGWNVKFGTCPDSFVAGDIFRDLIFFVGKVSGEAGQDFIRWNEILPDIAQDEFVNCIVTMFDLVILTDPFSKTVCLETSKKYFGDLTNVEDWSDKVNCVINQKSVGGGFCRDLRWKYKEDSSDEWMAEGTRRYNAASFGRDVIFGEKYIDNQGSIVENCTQPIVENQCFAATKMWSFGGINNEDNVQPFWMGRSDGSDEIEPRILVYRGLVDGLWYIQFAEPDPADPTLPWLERQYTQIPQAYFYGHPTDSQGQYGHDWGVNLAYNDWDIYTAGVGESELSQSVGVGISGDKGLVSKFWSEDISQVINGRILTVEVRLTLDDIHSIANNGCGLNYNSVICAFGKTFLINQIKEFDPLGDGLTEVELISLNKYLN